MCSVIFTTFLILSFSTVLYSKSISNNRPDENRMGCSLWMEDEDDALKMPVPFTLMNGPRVSLVYPDDKGRLNFKYGDVFKLSCTKSNFSSDALQNAGNEALVVCVGGDSLMYREQTLKYADFKCDAMPKSELRVTEDTCQPANNTVVAVGFMTNYAFLTLYNVCFDKSTKNSLYTWYNSRSPYYDHHQKMTKRPSFVKSRELYGKTDVNKKYTVAEQRKTVAKILRSEELASKYIQNDGKHSLSRGHYAAKADFFFGFEQSATFYYANVAPQWQIFNGNIWADLEDTIRSKMDNDTLERYVVVTGTYGSCTLADVDDVQQPLYLDLPNSIPVPQFYWKLLYNVDSQNGTVYVGLNNPYAEIDDSLFICPNTCPDGIHGEEQDSTEYQDGNEEQDDNEGLIYCCTKESFENVYGKLDPAVFKLPNNLNGRQIM